MRRITILPGDGIGEEVMDEALKVLETIMVKYKVFYDSDTWLVGGEAIDSIGDPLPDQVIESCISSEAVLFGAVGGPKWDTLELSKTPAQAIIRLRKELDCNVNLRAFRVYPGLTGLSPLCEKVVGDSLDFVIARELSSGAYYGEPRFRKIADGVEIAVDTIVYRDFEVRRLAEYGFQLARTRRKKLTCMSKWNVLQTSRLWYDIVNEVADKYQDVQFNHEIVDAGAMNLVRDPTAYDVIIMPNMYGDILGDQCAGIVGSLGLIPSASFGVSRGAIYEPIHGAANDIAGKGVANPIGMILSLAMMLRFSLDLPEGATDVERAVETVLSRGLRTADICETGTSPISTKDMGDAITEQIQSSAPVRN